MWCRHRRGKHLYTFEKKIRFKNDFYNLIYDVLLLRNYFLSCNLGQSKGSIGWLFINFYKKVHANVFKTQNTKQNNMIVTSFMANLAMSQL